MASRLAELGSRYELPGPAVDQLGRVLTVLSEDPAAPTSVRDPERVLEDHLADSLVALDLEPVRRARRVADLGSGAGLPGIPLAIALPGTEFALVESAGRKCAFIERLAVTCSLENVEVIHSRAENWRSGIGRSDLVTVRALTALDVVLEYAAPLLVIGGLVVAWRGRRDADAEAAASRAAENLGLEVSEVRRARPYPEAHDRYLHLFLKVRETPDRFPRRAGVAAKRPLGRH